MEWFRIDNRLVHGQVIAAWLPHLRARILVVANNELAGDGLRREIMCLAVPSDITFLCCPVSDTADTLRRIRISSPDEHVLVLFADCADARAAYLAGAVFQVLNLGNLHYGPGKEQICEHIALSQDDRNCLQYFTDQGVEIDFRCVPTATPKVTAL